METSKVEFHPEARQEYLDAVAWYAEHSQTVARRFQDQISLSLQQIVASPDRWPHVEATVRWVRLHRFPDVLSYSTARDRIDVLAVAHERRRPGYWRDRVTAS